MGSVVYASCMSDEPDCLFSCVIVRDHKPLIVPDKVGPMELYGLYVLILRDIG